MNDSALEREIEAALTVDPSPEFVTRVRMRVAETPATAVWQWRWEFAVAGLVAIVVPVWIANIPTARSVVPIAASSLTESFIGPSTSGDSGQISEVVSDAPRERTVRAVAAMVPPFPDVIISPDEVRAFHALIKQVQAGRLAPVRLGDFVPEATTVLGDIAIEPVTIEPLPLLALLEGARP